MPLTSGERLGPYEIVAPIGVGGMGEVYRARDSKLNRDVAIKILPAALAHDAQYMARFERDAQTLASLNHPNIATVYGIEQGAIVMELIEGADLRGPLLKRATIFSYAIAEFESTVSHDFSPLGGAVFETALSGQERAGRRGGANS